MRTRYFLFSLLLAQACLAQEAWRSIFSVDPEMSNGYFILDEAKCNALSVAEVDVYLLIHKLHPGAGYTTQVLGSISMTPADHYGRLDFTLAPALEPGDILGYHVQALDANNNIVFAFDRTDGSHPRSEICRSTCNSNSYAWSLRAMANEQQSNTIIELMDGTNNFGQPLYFYVKNMWDADGFAQQFDPSDFCLTGSDWNQTLNNAPLDCFAISNVGGLPNYLGQNLPVNAGPGYAVRKGKGPWCGFYAVTGQLSGTDYCTSPEILRDHFNSDSTVLNQMYINEVEALTCDAAYLSGGGPGWNEWGSGDGTGQCVSFSYSEVDSDGDGILDVGNWVSDVIDCPTTTAPIYQPGLADVSSIDIKPWFTPTPGPLVHIDIPDENDPKLVPVPRTRLDPGLYEYMVVMRDGVIWRKFESYDHPVTVCASFASFTEVAVYPVPVDRLSFSVDFETLAPLTVNITVINNQGTVYYQKMDTFPLAGRNKHVVTMQNQWPSGLYHVLIGYGDGSTDSIGITVQ